MAVTGLMYGQAPLHMASKRVDWLNDTIKCSLHAVGYVPNQDTDDFFNDAGAEVAATGGYTAGGTTLTTKTLTYTGGTNVVMFDADDAVWPAATITARVVVVYDATPGTAATNPLLCYQLSTTDIAATGGEFRVAWAAAGIMTITAA